MMDTILTGGVGDNPLIDNIRFGYFSNAQLMNDNSHGPVYYFVLTFAGTYNDTGAPWGTNNKCLFGAGMADYMSEWYGGPIKVDLLTGSGAGYMNAIWNGGADNNLQPGTSGGTRGGTIVLSLTRNEGDAEHCDSK